MKTFHFFFILAIFYSCSSAKQIAKSARENILDNAALETAHIGISVYDPSSKKYLYNYQGDKYFVPASNTKIPTCYAAMKYLGDSLVGIRYGIPEGNAAKHTIVFEPAADPSFLHEDFSDHPVMRFLYDQIVKENKRPGFLFDTVSVLRWGNGWSWNDYASSYMAERSSFPIFGNTVTIRLRDSLDRFIPHPLDEGRSLARPFYTGNNYFDSVINGSKPISGSLFKAQSPLITLNREIDANDFRIIEANDAFRTMRIPFVTQDHRTAQKILEDTLKRSFTMVLSTETKGKYAWLPESGDISFLTIHNWQKIHSQPTDSLLKPMMHESDNFFAEQSLLMASKEFLDVMNENRIIDTLLKKDFADLPQKPRWADGSGLSRYNLFTPQDMVAILSKMRDSFGMERIKTIFPTGNEGTLRNYYVTDSTHIYAKTGTLSGVVALSGFLYTSENRLLIFSILVNNHRTDATEVRRSVEKFVKELRNYRLFR